MSDFGVYAGLFLAAMGAATLLPLQSEALLVGLLAAQAQPVGLLIGVASVGNVLGSTVNWWLGRSIERFRDRRWFPLKEPAFGRAQRWYHRYGRWTLLLSWMPVIGDALTLIAGVLRERLVPFVLIVAIAKTARYMVVAGLTLEWIS
ncbi:MAG: YqaA family protein [Gammaproteobacteria bacterium]